MAATLGFGACSPWLIERLERPAGRLPLASRLALRDTARARSRNGPIITAILASFAATVALAAYTASADASAAAHWQPWLQPDQLYLQGEAAKAGPEVAKALGAIAAAPIPGIGSNERQVWLSLGTGSDPNQVIYNATVGDAELLYALGAESATDELNRGAVILLTAKPSDTARVTVHITDTQGAEIDTRELPAVVVATGLTTSDLPQAVMSAQTAARLNLVAGINDRWVVRLPHRVTDAEVAKAGAIAATYPDTWVDASLGPPRAGEGFRIATLIASILLALSVTGVAVALGEAESRPDQRTLLALGADPQLRRWVAAARAASIALLAGALAIPAGLLPVWGLLASRKAPFVVPVPEVIVAVVVLPLLATIGALLFSRPIPSWSAFRDLTR